jgi:hypothetical protein
MSITKDLSGRRRAESGNSSISVSISRALRPTRIPGERPLLTRQSHARHSFPDRQRFRIEDASGSTPPPARAIIARNARYSALSRAPPPSSGRANRLPQAMCQFCDKRDRENSSFCVLPIFIVDEDHNARERCCMTIGEWNPQTV